MRLLFDPRFVEEVVSLLARKDRARWSELRRRFDPLYEEPDRHAALATAELELFHSWGAAAICEQALALAEGIDRALVARSRRPGDEGADLLVGEDGTTAMLRLAAERFADVPALRIFLRHEMRHVADMLDAEFGYAPDLGVHGRTYAEKELVRARYGVLWNIAIDAVEAPPVPPTARWSELDQAFAALNSDQRTRLMKHFRDPAHRRHAELSAAARNPWAVLGEAERDGPLPGAPCPLCGFPTHDWCEDPPLEAIRQDYPDWDQEHGACGQCADIYRVAEAGV